MKSIFKKVKQKGIELQMNALNVLREDRGDTNFVSIAIVLTIVLVLAAVFIIFGRQIIDSVGQAIEDFMAIFEA